ncbi:unnamed protein product [Amoebophrya sp. A120]|nr:unnamed protein product [Amoebophrya sp. A120]|eukprot:GSA120T00005338001.1
MGGLYATTSSPCFTTRGHSGHDLSLAIAKIIRIGVLLASCAAIFNPAGSLTAVVAISTRSTNDPSLFRGSSSPPAGQRGTRKKSKPNSGSMHDDEPERTGVRIEEPTIPARFGFSRTVKRNLLALGGTVAATATATGIGLSLKLAGSEDGNNRAGMPAAPRHVASTQRKAALLKMPKGGWFPRDMPSIMASWFAKKSSPDRGYGQRNRLARMNAMDLEVEGRDSNVSASLLAEEQGIVESEAALSLWPTNLGVPIQLGSKICNLRGSLCQKRRRGGENQTDTAEDPSESAAFVNSNKEKTGL